LSPETVLALAPEIALVATAVLIYIAGAFLRGRGAWSLVAVGGIVLAAALLAASVQVTGGPLSIDAMAQYVRWLALGTGALLVLSASRPLDDAESEYVGSLLLVVAGVMIVAGASELVLLFVGLELVSIPTYVLLGVGRRDAGGQEAAAKYFFLSILASAMLLYGFSFLYGSSGSTDLAAIRDRLADGTADSGGAIALASVAVVLVFAGLGFKIAAVPFHFYAPDVYQGTSHANAAVLSVVPKAAGLVALVRLLGVTLGSVEAYPWQIAMALAMLTMTFGNVMALWQQNVRRLLAYSSIAHAGYMLIGLSAYLASKPTAGARWDGVGSLLVYLLVYAVATIGTFAALACLGRGERQLDAVEELAGLAWTAGPLRPLLAVSIGVFMFSLAGIPPLAGFWGKLAIFASALNVEGVSAGARVAFVLLAVIGVLNAAVAAAYYLRIVGVMFFRMPLGTPAIQDRAGGMLLAALVSLGLVVFIGLAPGDWLQSANDASPAQVQVSQGIGD
jgi:NADH-quinone oxidoreductase subunit N